MSRLKLLTLASLITSSAAAEVENSLWVISLAELGSIEVTEIASGSPTPLNRAAAITTVITSTDLRRTGARDLEDALMSVPGLYVSRSDQAFTPMYIFRGIYGSLNPQALLMINGIPRKTLPHGNRGNGWVTMPVEAIDRIEVIRGPGSALYGADAFAGVINIITKTSQESSGGKVGARYGSYNSADAWVQYGGEIAGWDSFVSLEIGATEGHDDVIETDTQTQLDGLLGTSASNAPGNMNTEYKNLDMLIDVSKDEWRIRAGYQRRDDVGLGVGIAEALDPTSLYESESASTDITFTTDTWDQRLDLVSEVSLFYGAQTPEGDTYIFPEGMVMPDVCVFIGSCGGPVYSFPDGYIGNPGYKELQARFTQHAVYTGFDNHRVRVAIGYTWGDLYQTTESKNFNTDNSPKPGGVTDVSDTDEVWLPEETRESYFFSIQDEWQISRDWQFVAGARYDKYSDFGDTLNPRLALVWLTTDDWTTRLLYGRAFRAPSMSELYAAANPVALGDTELDPEIIDTFELAFHHSLESGTHYSVNFFYYRIDDLILNLDQQYSNIGERRGRGAELEFQNELSASLSIMGNYSYQESKDLAEDDDVGNAPNNQAYISLNWALDSDWNVNVEAVWLGRVERAPGDPRDPMDSASLLNFTVTRMDVWQDWEVALNVRNLLDEDWHTPSVGSAASVNVPNDYPAPGRNANITVRYDFE